MQGADDGFFTTRTVLPELFDRATINCVLQEWFKTIVDLPAGLRMAVEMVRDRVVPECSRSRVHNWQSSHGERVLLVIFVVETGLSGALAASEPSVRGLSF